MCPNLHLRNNPFKRQVCVLIAGLVSSWTGLAHATDSAAAAAAVAKLLALPAPASEAAAATPTKPAVTVLRGETLDRVIRRTLPAQPFKDEFLRKAFVQLNPGVLDNRSSRPLPAGTTLNVPTAQDLLAMLGQQYPALFKTRANETSEEAPASSTGTKRRWVQYP